MYGLITNIFVIIYADFVLLSTSVIFNTLFGLSSNFWMAIVSRFLLGSLNCLVGPIKLEPSSTPAFSSRQCMQ